MTNLIGISGKIGSGKDTVGSILTMLHVNFEDKTIVNHHKQGGCNFYNWQVKKFAGKLKQIVCILLGCTLEQLEDRAFKEKELEQEWWYHSIQRDGYGRELIPYDPNNTHLEIIKLTPRRLMQLVGTECGRQILHPSIWENALFADYRQETFKEEVSRTPYYDNQDGSYINDHIEYKKVLKYPNWIITDVRFPNEAEAIKKRGGILIRVNRWEGYRMPESERWNGPEGTRTKEHASETGLDEYTDWDYVIGNNKDLDTLLERVKEIAKALQLI